MSWIIKVTMYRLLLRRRIFKLLLIIVSIATLWALIPLWRKPRDGSQLSRHKLAIVVPFRDRFDELLTFVPHISKFLHRQNIDYKLYIINQSPRYRFNRGALANVGYSIAKNETDYICIHDVDLLPLNSNLSYAYPDNGPYHLSSPEYHPQYNYRKYIGGILLINNRHYELVNGFSNQYFGWGLEDDEFYTRIRAANLSINRPKNLTSDHTNTFLHFHHNRKRDKFKTKEQLNILRRRDKTTGLHTLKYSILSSHNVTIDNLYSCSIYDVEIHCDPKRTPWCLHSYVKSSIAKTTTP